MCASILREGQSQGSLEGGFFVNAVILETSTGKFWECWEDQDGSQQPDHFHANPPKHHSMSSSLPSKKKNKPNLRMLEPYLAPQSFPAASQSSPRIMLQVSSLQI